MLLFEITQKYLKNDCQFFDTLKTKDRKIRGNCNLLIKVKFHQLEWSSPLSLFDRYYFGRCSSELAQLVPLPFSRGSSAHSDRLHDFSVTIPRCYKDVYVNMSFLAQLDSGILCL